MSECKNLLKQIVQPHLTEKSLGRIDMVFAFFSNPNFLDVIFKKNSDYNEIMTRIISDMHNALEQGELWDVRTCPIIQTWFAPVRCLLGVTSTLISDFKNIFRTRENIAYLRLICIWSHIIWAFLNFYCIPSTYALLIVKTSPLHNLKCSQHSPLLLDAPWRYKRQEVLGSLSL